MNKVAKIILALGLAGCAATNSPFAMADDSGWYVGGNIGRTKAKIDNAGITRNLLGGGFTTTSIAEGKRDGGYKIFGGYQYNRNFAVEAGYFDLGQFGYMANVVPGGTLTGKIRLKGVNIDAVGILPFTEQFSAFGRLGLNYAQTRDNFTNTGLVPALANPNPGKNDTNYKFGFGLQYDFTESLGMRAEAERYRINDAVGHRSDVDMLSLGLVYRFDAEKPVPPPRVIEPEPVAVAPAPEPVVVPPTPHHPPPAPKKKATFSADSSTDALFGFGKSNVKPSGKIALDRFASELKGANYEVITVTGHTDRIGSHKYNMKLSTQRAEAVKVYLVESAGIPADKIEVRGVDGAEPVTKPGECKGTKATPKLVACLAPDRRVEVEVSATRATR